MNTSRIAAMLEQYDPENDLGLVTYHDARLAEAVLDLAADLDALRAQPVGPRRTWLRVHDSARHILYLDAASVDALRSEDDGSLTVWLRRSTVGYTVAEPVDDALRRLGIEL